MPDTDGCPVRAIDHANLTQPWQTAEDTVLFLRSVFGLTPDAPAEVPGPDGSGPQPGHAHRGRRDPDPAQRRAARARPVRAAAARRVRLHRRRRAGPRAADRGLAFLPVSDNYYDYLRGRFGLGAHDVAELRELNLLYDRSADGHFVHFYTRTVGSVFLEFVQRFGAYDGYGTDNAPVRLAAQRAARYPATK